MNDHFQTLGVPRQFDLDGADLERRFRALSRTLHPDKFASAPPAERRAALEKATALNDAYRVLRDPQRRATHFFELHGVALEPGPDGRSAVTMDPEFLGAFLDLRERLEGADAAEHRAQRDRLVAERAQRLSALGADLAALGDAPTPAQLLGPAERLLELRYYDRALETLEAELEAEAAGETGPAASAAP